MGQKNRFKSVTRGVEFIIYPSNCFKDFEYQYKSVIPVQRDEKLFDDGLVRIKVDGSWTEGRVVDPIDLCTSIDLVCDRPDLDDCMSDYTRYEVEQIIQDQCKDCVLLAEEAGVPLHYAFNLHDNDRDEFGHKKKNHYHVLLWDARDQEYNIQSPLIDAFCKVFHQMLPKLQTDFRCKKQYGYVESKYQTYVLVPDRHLVNPIIKLNSAIRYLIHVDNRDKVVYPLANIVSDMDMFGHVAFREMTTMSKLAFLIENIDNGNCKDYRDVVHLAMQHNCFDVMIKQKLLIQKYLENVVYTGDRYVDHLPVVTTSIADNFYKFVDDQKVNNVLIGVSE